jgi:outer membrane protein
MNKFRCPSRLFRRPQPSRPPHRRPALYLTAAALLALSACADLSPWSTPTDDYIGPFRPHERHPSFTMPSNFYDLPANQIPASFPSSQPSTLADSAPGLNPSSASTQPLSPELRPGLLNAEPATRNSELLPATQPAATLAVNVRRAILLSLENNPDLAIQRLNPAIQRTGEQQQRAAFDPIVDADISAGRSRTVRHAGPGTGGSDSTVNQINGDLSGTEFLPTGTTISLGGSTAFTDSPQSADTADSTRVGLTVTQSLLRGAGVAVNLVSLRQARIDVLTSQYELRGFAESLLEQVENTYWDYALAQRQIEIFTQALQVAQEQLEETRQLINVGKLAEVELAAAEAEAALRLEDLINARSALETTRLNLLRLLNPTGPGMYDRPVLLEDQPFIVQGQLDPVEAHVRVALKMRADLNQARLQVKRGDLDIVKTRNGLLPKLDLFITLGKSGYADSFGSSLTDMGGRSYDALGGLRYELPVGNRSAEAADLRARLSREQAGGAVDNLERLVELDVRTAYIEITRSREQITATAATRRLQEIKLNTEKEKFRVGKSTSILVAQAERDFTASRIAEVQSVVANLKSAVTLFRLEGSLLERRGIAAPAPDPAQ